LGNVRLVFTESNGLASIVQENHYYPFGMQQNGNWAKTQTVKNDYLYNGKELNTEIGLNWSDYGFRNYDAAIGRFTGVDPISDQFAWVNTYNYAENEPVGSIDLWGLQRWTVNGRERTNTPSRFTQMRMQTGAAVSNPIAASNIGSVERGGTNISSVSGRIARHLAENGNMSLGIGSERNAFRHSLWSATITSQFGNEVATEITNAHEGVGVGDVSAIDMTTPFEGNEDLADSIVDILNNDIGMGVGLSNEGATSLELAAQILKVFATTGLWVATTDENGNVGIQRQSINIIQYMNGIVNLNNLDQNGMSEEDRRQLEEDE